MHLTALIAGRFWLLLMFRVDSAALHCLARENASLNKDLARCCRSAGKLGIAIEVVFISFAIKLAALGDLNLSH